MKPELVSFDLCPFVQRSVIADFAEKYMEYVFNIDGYAAEEFRKGL